MDIVLVHSVKSAEEATRKGKLPVVDVVTDFWLSYDLHRMGIRQATMQECVKAGFKKTDDIPRFKG